MRLSDWAPGQRDGRTCPHTARASASHSHTGPQIGAVRVCGARVAFDGEADTSTRYSCMLQCTPPHIKPTFLSRPISQILRAVLTRTFARLIMPDMRDSAPCSGQTSRPPYIFNPSDIYLIEVGNRSIVPTHSFILNYVHKYKKPLYFFIISDFTGF